MTEWHRVQGWDRTLTANENRARGVDLPEVGRFVIVLWTSTKRGFGLSFADETYVDGTRYQNGMVWAYIDLPEEYQGYNPLA